MLEQGRLACGRGCQSVCGPHMQDAAQICFFAHSPEEVRHPSTKPFVPPEALAAATTGATLEAVRKAAADSDAHKKEVRAASHGPMSSNTFKLTWAVPLPHTSCLAVFAIAWQMSWQVLRLLCRPGPLTMP